MEEGLLSGKKINIKTRIWKEVKLIWETAFPSTVTRVSAFGILLTTQTLFFGQLSEFDISAFALVQICLIRFIHGTIIGMSIEEISLQQSKDCDLLTAVITFPFFAFAATTLLVEQESGVHLVEKFYLSSIPFLHYLVFNLTIQMILQPRVVPTRSFSKVWMVWFSGVSFALHTLLKRAFGRELDLGEVIGSLVATSITSWASGISQFVYFYGGWFHSNKASECNLTANLEVWPIIKFSVSSAIVLCSDLWYNSNILLLLAGYMSEVTAESISTFSICLNICSWEYMICLGFLSCACIRVSNELAKGNTEAAKFCIKVILGISLLVGALFYIMILVLPIKFKMAYFASIEDLQVADSLLDLSILFFLSILIKSINPVLSGAAIGAGLEGTVAIVNICRYYVIGIPLGALLAYVSRLQVKGLWIGVLCGELVQLLVLIGCLIWKLDWQY